MWKVTLPDNSASITQLKTALTYKNGTHKYRLTDEEITAIENIYNQYDRLNGIGDERLQGELISSATKSAVHNAYSEVQEAGRLNQLRSSLILAANYCPCCGISPADELDHHLPRSVYHLLAVYARNLIPMCHKCNNKKRAVTGADPNARFLHVYYERIPEDVQFFKMRHTISSNQMTFEFYVDRVAEVSESLFNQMVFQMDRVNLNTRLQREVNTFISSFGVGLKWVFDVSNDSNSVKDFLLQNSDVFKRNFGLNDWRTVTLKALADCPVFCSGGFVQILGLDVLPA